jgi:hypothetical protein
MLVGSGQAKISERDSVLFEAATLTGRFYWECFRMHMAQMDEDLAHWNVIKKFTLATLSVL